MLYFHYIYHYLLLILIKFINFHFMNYLIFYVSIHIVKIIMKVFFIKID
jgi:hypothetical protein